VSPKWIEIMVGHFDEHTGMAASWLLVEKDERLIGFLIFQGIIKIEDIILCPPASFRFQSAMPTDRLTDRIFDTRSRPRLE